MKLRQKLASLAALLSLICLVGSASATNLVYNGDFELGNTDFSSSYGYVATPGSFALWDEGNYAVGSNPQNYHYLWYSFGPHDGSNMMIINGAGSPVDVWATAAPITVTPQTQYYFSTWVASNYPTSPADWVFKINGTQLGTDFIASSTPGLWQQFYCTWYSGSQTTASLSIFNLNTALSGNDFSLDDISLDTVGPTSGTGVGGTVPLPPTVLLLGSGLLGLIGLRRKPRRGNSDDSIK